MFALGSGYHCVDGAWDSWDIEGPGGARIEVKQSSALASWSDPNQVPLRTNRGSFDIAVRQWVWINEREEKASARAADVYVFAFHPVTDPAVADHRDAGQWQFIVVRSEQLPPAGKTIGWRSLTSLYGEPLSVDELPVKMAETLAGLVSVAGAAETAG